MRSTNIAKGIVGVALSISSSWSLLPKLCTDRNPHRNPKGILNQPPRVPRRPPRTLTSNLLNTPPKRFKPW